jgi:hypothetical protein
MSDADFGFAHNKWFFWFCQCRITVGIADAGAAFLSEAIGLHSENQLRRDCVWVVGNGVVRSMHCYVLLARSLHGEANRGAEIQCTPYTMVFCFFLFLTHKITGRNEGQNSYPVQLHICQPMAIIVRVSMSNPK